jgi:hypothetical protein
MFMAKSNGKAEESYENVVLVAKTTDLPYAYIPYHNIANARVNHPEDTLYVFEPGKPAGYKIVAFPILMTKPEEEANAES